MRLIDADALKERLLGHKVPDEPIADQAHKELIYAIDSLPTVCDIEQIRADIEAARYGLINDGLDVALSIIDKYTKGE